MRARSTGQVRVDLLKDVHDNAELAKLAGKFGYRMLLQPSGEEGNTMWEAVLTRTGETFLREDLAHLVFLTALTDGKSPAAVLTDIATSLRDRHHVDLDVPPADQWAIGERHPDGQSEWERTARMKIDGYTWGDASVPYIDWIGTAALDQRRTGPLIEEIVGLDHNKWMVIGLDFGGGETTHELNVLAVPQELIPEGGDVLPRITQANGGTIPVTQFKVHDVDPYEVLRKITHVFELRLRVARTENLDIRVVELGDIPEQNDAV